MSHINDTSRRTALILGGTKGIGEATAIELSCRGWRVIVVGRDRVAGAKLVRALGHDASFIAADLSLMSSVRQLAEAVRETAPRLELVMHSADVLRTERLDTAERLEVSFATNFLGRVLLNHLLQSALSDGGAVVHVAAAGFPGPLEVADIPPREKTSAMAAHNLGQRANDVYGLELSERIQTRGIRVFVLHPGMVDTGLRRASTPVSWIGRWLVALLTWLARPWTVTPADYAARLVAFLVQSSTRAPHVLYDRNFRPIAPRKRFAQAAFRAEVWRRAHEVVGVSQGELVDTKGIASSIDR